MFKRNPGRFTHKITLMKPSKPVRDELGGLSETTYEPVIELFAMCEQKDQSRQPFVGDYVTADTRYFVFREIKEPIDTSWRLMRSNSLMKAVRTSYRSRQPPSMQGVESYELQATVLRGQQSHLQRLK